MGTRPHMPARLPLPGALCSKREVPQGTVSAEDPASRSEGKAEKPQECEAPNFLNLRQWESGIKAS